jgi:hypothetical protein
MGELINQPALRHAVHPDPDEGDQLANKEEPEVAVPKGSKGGRYRIHETAPILWEAGGRGKANLESIWHLRTEWLLEAFEEGEVKT